MQDLSDKTDHQVHKIVQVIDKKSSDIQSNITFANAGDGRDLLFAGTGADRITRNGGPVAAQQFAYTRKGTGRHDGRISKR